MPLPEYPRSRVQAPKGAGIGLRIPEREADCTGQRPSWYPFQVNVCDCDDVPDPQPFTSRMLRLPPPSSTPYPPGDPCL